MPADALALEGLAGGGADEAVPVETLHRFLGRTPTALDPVPLDDLAGSPEQANLPGTVDDHPNRRPRYPLPVAAVAADPAGRAPFAAVRAERPG
jgi:4-alpha-glucanotransferase